MQQLLKQNIDWDEPIPNSLLKQREFWKEDLQFLFDINIPRWFGIEKQLDKRIELNIFCDAPSETYGAVGYVNYFYECPQDIFLVFYYRNLSSLLSKKNPWQYPA